jgi:nucleotide-binding universal stress UspA family protein
MAWRRGDHAGGGGREAEDILEAAAARARAAAGIEPEQVTRIGVKAEEIVRLIEEDEDISFLVLAAGTGKEGPGPLVSTLVGKTVGSFPIPGRDRARGLTDPEIDALGRLSRRELRFRTRAIHIRHAASTIHPAGLEPARG